MFQLALLEFDDTVMLGLPKILFWPFETHNKT